MTITLEYNDRLTDVVVDDMCQTIYFETLDAVIDILANYENGQLSYDAMVDAIIMPNLESVTAKCMDKYKSALESDEQFCSPEKFAADFADSPTPSSYAENLFDAIVDYAVNEFNISIYGE